MRRRVHTVHWSALYSDIGNCFIAILHGYSSNIFTWSCVSILWAMGPVMRWVGVKKGGGAENTTSRLMINDYADEDQDDRWLCWWVGGSKINVMTMMMTTMMMMMMMMVMMMVMMVMMTITLMRWINHQGSRKWWHSSWTLWLGIIIESFQSLVWLCISYSSGILKMMPKKSSLQEVQEILLLMTVIGKGN